MNATQNHPPLAARSFHDRRCSIGILSHNLTPAGKLRAIFPVALDRRCADSRNRRGSLVNSAIHYRVKTEPHTRQIQTIARGISRQNSSAADSQIIQTALHGVVNVRRGGWRQASRRE